MEEYNGSRTNQGKHCKGRTPMETFTNGLDLREQYVQNNGKEVNEVAA